MNTEANTATTTAAVQQRRLDPVAAALTASAFLLAGLFIVTVGGLFDRPALADSAVSSSGSSLVSMRASNNDDIVVTLDEQTGVMRVFGVGLRGGRNVQQYERYNLDELFAQAQRASRGR